MTNVNGYITEKIFDCFIGNIVPIYLGANNVESYIPKNTFIDFNSFSNVPELMNFLQNLSDFEYKQYLLNANKFINSSKAKLFSFHTFTDTILKVINKNINKPPSRLNIFVYISVIFYSLLIHLKTCVKKYLSF
jgi:hypothetical protein